MVFNFKKIKQRHFIGIFFYIGVLQYILSIIISEGIAINYSPALHYVSSLGVGSTAFYYNLSVIILGLFMISSSYFLHQEYSKILPTILLVLTAICTIGIGLFPENFRPYHGIFTGFVFIFAPLFLISSIKIDKSPPIILLSCIGISILLLGFIFFPYLGLEIDSQLKYLGLLKGTLERILIYSLLLSFLLLGGYLSYSKPL